MVVRKGIQTKAMYKSTSASSGVGNEDSIASRMNLLALQWCWLFVSKGRERRIMFVQMTMAGPSHLGVSNQPRFREAPGQGSGRVPGFERDTTWASPANRSPVGKRLLVPPT